jgi:hypothetical protein
MIVKALKESVALDVKAGDSLNLANGGLTVREALE